MFFFTFCFCFLFRYVFHFHFRFRFRYRFRSSFFQFAFSVSGYLVLSFTEIGKQTNKPRQTNQPTNEQTLCTKRTRKSLERKAIRRP